MAPVFESINGLSNSTQQVYRHQPFGTLTNTNGIQNYDFSNTGGYTFNSSTAGQAGSINTLSMGDGLRGVATYSIASSIK